MYQFGGLEIQEFQLWPGQKLPLNDFVSEYRKLYAQAKQLFAQHNPCDIHDSTCLRGRKDGGTHFCCSGCEYQASDGCTTDSIWCALWTCIAIQGVISKDFKAQLNALNHKANDLCHGHGGRYGLSRYIRKFYGPEAYESWKTIQTSINSMCGLSAS